LNNGTFLGVETSATGRAWRSRLDERGSARALAIAQRHDLPELLARILAGRNVEVDAVEAFLDPTIKRTMPDPNVLTAMPEAAARVAEAIVRWQRNSTTRLRVSCPTSRTSEHSSAGARGCDVRMFGCLPLDEPHREGGLLAGLGRTCP
jgi:hypothetical protein